LETGTLNIYGNQTNIPLEIDKFNLSNHADHSSLCRFARDCKPSNLVIFHSDSSAANAITEELAKEMQVHNPSNNDPLTIDFSQFE